MNICKNCSSEDIENYCSQCGNPVKLKRIDASYIKHEIEHVLHFEKGIFYTIKELILRPGKNIREFIAENRSRLVKPIIFVIITSLVYSLINIFFHIEDQYVKIEGKNKSLIIFSIVKWIQNHYGYTNLITGIFTAFFVKKFFKKFDYNFFEITILMYFIIGIQMLIFSIFALFQGITGNTIWMIFATIITLFYYIFAVTDFYNYKNYIMSLLAYLFGAISFWGILIIVGVSSEIIVKILK